MNTAEQWKRYRDDLWQLIEDKRHQIQAIRDELRPLEKTWADAVCHHREAEMREQILAELKTTYRGEERLP